MKTLIASMFLSLTLLGASVAYAAPAAKPATAVKAPVSKDVAVCRDGKTYSNATGEHRGACSGHGGVASWADGTPVKGKSSASYR